MSQRGSIVSHQSSLQWVSLPLQLLAGGIHPLPSVMPSCVWQASLCPWVCSLLWLGAGSHHHSSVIPDIGHRGSIRKDLEPDSSQRHAGVTQRGNPMIVGSRASAGWAKILRAAQDDRLGVKKRAFGQPHGGAINTRPSSPQVGGGDPSEKKPRETLAIDVSPRRL